MLVEFKGMFPDVEKAAFIAPNAAICGDVAMDEGSSVWFSAVIRGEVAPIRIGKNSNVQDNAMLHSDYDCPVTLGDRVSVGHNAIVHGATIEDDVTVGMHATVMNGAVIGAGSMVAAGALVKERSVIPPCSLVVGVQGDPHARRPDGGPQHRALPRSLHSRRPRIRPRPHGGVGNIGDGDGILCLAGRNESQYAYSHLKKRTAITVHTAAHTAMIATGTTAWSTGSPSDVAFSSFTPWVSGSRSAPRCTAVGIIS